ncbi:MAG: hypothetical protein ACTSYW_00480 [Candidatus Heimdallarchaeota archaeon]
MKKENYEAGIPITIRLTKEQYEYGITKRLKELIDKHPTRNVEDNFSIIAHELAAIGKRLERLEKNK